MTKIKFTKGELKRQRDCLAQFERFLPTLQLKKQQLQIEILHKRSILEEKRRIFNQKKAQIQDWIGLSTDDVDLRPFLLVKEIKFQEVNVAGVDIPVFQEVSFYLAEYDLFLMPLWLDLGIERLRELISLKEEIKVLQEAILILKQELITTSQRVNLFEKVKIPEAKENIRLIKVYLGDQMANAVARSKIAKRKLEAYRIGELV